MCSIFRFYIGGEQRKPSSKVREGVANAKAAGLQMMVCAPRQETMDAIEKLVQEFDIKIAIHNHGPEDKFFPSPASAFEAVKDRDPRMGLCIDVGHTTRTSTNVLESIREAGPRLFDFHIKDLSDLMDKGSQVEVGRGAMPVTGIFELLKTMNYQFFHSYLQFHLLGIYSKFHYHHLSLKRQYVQNRHRYPHV